MALMVVLDAMFEVEKTNSIPPLDMRGPVPLLPPPCWGRGRLVPVDGERRAAGAEGWRHGENQTMEREGTVHVSIQSPRPPRQFSMGRYCLDLTLTN